MNTAEYCCMWSAFYEHTPEQAAEFLAKHEALAAMTPEQRSEHLAQQLKAQENEPAPF